MNRLKKTWTTAQWIAFGNRAKHVKSELQLMIMDMQGVCGAKELEGLFKVLRQVDKWKCMMENEAIRHRVSGVEVSRIFYGDPMPENKSDTVPSS